MTHHDIVVIGGGQSGLAAGFYLRRAGADFEILDASDGPGGAWPHTWPSLRLFSPADFSSLPGRRMPRTDDGANPDAAHVVDYLRGYEEYYDFPVRRGVRVVSVERFGPGREGDDDEGFLVRAADGRSWRARAVISATGTFSRPFVPTYPGATDFRGRQLHSAEYRGPAGFEGERVVVVGGANSGAQIAADLVRPLAGSGGSLIWCTTGPPRYLPDDVDGRELFRVANAAIRGVGDSGGIADLGDIVAVPPVRAARDAGLLEAIPMFERFTSDGVEWSDGRREPVDTVVWCTGFRPELGHLRGLLPRRDGRVVTRGVEVQGVPGLFLLGYGDWCGAASATLIGVGQWAKAAVTSALA
ncbi:ArsO family NAD(P)H-dependent flavin-containing monooxygenase [Dietzia sp. B32]|uniref:ArsO family NAD(P)H-dependent flavin-containing monooxygenase n=1 Tax=Dietzia sp. B32 TaxID=2915130 RepID=UPI0021AD7BFA|nr:ArsO family NAD(P)H-dependent flavin-containing monooxygenase [Dietzia sp. B32]UVE96811.1 ArsO family NAD(P)H-dependent flavin-containing monooxygenase [Dietzia sp. B32]